MKGKYNLTDKEYLEAVKRLSQICEENNIDYAIIGGAAVQIILSQYIESRTTLQQQLRRTGDIDIAVDCSLEEMVLALNKAATEGDIKNQGNNVIYIGNIGINYSTPGELKGFQDLHRQVIDDSKMVYIKLNNREVKTIVVNPEQLIAAKLSGSFKEKDQDDIQNLYFIMKRAGENIKEQRLKFWLEKLNKTELYQTFISLTHS